MGFSASRCWHEPCPHKARQRLFTCAAWPPRGLMVAGLGEPICPRLADLRWRSASSAPRARYYAQPNPAWSSPSVHHLSSQVFSSRSSVCPPHGAAPRWARVLCPPPPLQQQQQPLQPQDLILIIEKNHWRFLHLIFLISQVGENNAWSQGTAKFSGHVCMKMAH